MPAFAGSKVSPKRRIDYFPPRDPLGDGYQGPQGSSSGAVASVAGYPRVHISLCKDRKESHAWMWELDLTDFYITKRLEVCAIQPYVTVPGVTAPLGILYRWKYSPLCPVRPRFLDLACFFLLGSLHYILTFWRGFDTIEILVRSSTMIQDLLLSSRPWGPIQNRKSCPHNPLPHLINN